VILNQKIFREYDIRGVVGVEFDASLAKRLGEVYAEAILKGQFDTAPTRTPVVAVGNDCRISADEISSALIEGIVSRGVDVIRTGMGPSPQLYFAVLTQNLDGGIQVTASHNPSDQNGFKMMAGKKTLSGPDILYLKQEVLKPSTASSRLRGKVSSLNARELYLEDLISRSKERMGTRKLKIVSDGGNGVGGLVGPDLLRALGCEVIELFSEPDGRFPNHHPDPTVVENIVELRKRVIAEGADCGIAWDGDADRIGVVDERAEPIYGDMLLAIYGRELLKEVPGATIIGDVKCSEHLFEDVRKHGGKAVISKTGHSLIKAKLKELHAELAGEMSGHMFFAHRYYGFDDAIHASARFVEILSNFDGPTSHLLDGIPKSFSTPEIRVDCADEIKFEVAEKAKALFPEYECLTLDGVRVKFDKGWGLVRASNTQPILVMRFEAESEELLKDYQSLVEGRIENLKQSMLSA